MQRRTVLVADEGSPGGRTALAAVRALAEGGHRPLVTVAGRPTLASVSRDSAGTVAVPANDISGWTAAVREALRPGVLVLPASDSAVVALGLPGAQLVDKRVVRARAAAAGLKTPDEQEFDGRNHLEQSSGDLPYPVVVKPAVRTGLTSIVPVLVPDASGLAGLPEGHPLVVQPFLQGEMKAFCALVREGRLVAAAHQRYERIWPTDCGVSSAAVTVEPDPVLESQVLEMVGDLDGIVQVQLIDGHVTDVNPRAYGSLPLAVRAGVNLPALWCADDVDRGGGTLRARVGVRYRWLDADVRSIYAAVRTREMTVAEGLAALRPHRDTAHSVVSWRDPRPALLRAARSLGSRS